MAATRLEEVCSHQLGVDSLDPACVTEADLGNVLSNQLGAVLSTARPMQTDIEAEIEVRQGGTMPLEAVVSPACSTQAEASGVRTCPPACGDDASVSPSCCARPMVFDPNPETEPGSAAGSDPFRTPPRDADFSSIPEISCVTVSDLGTPSHAISWKEAEKEEEEGEQEEPKGGIATHRGIGVGVGKRWSALKGVLRFSTALRHLAPTGRRLHSSSDLTSPMLGGIQVPSGWSGESDVNMEMSTYDELNAILQDPKTAGPTTATSLSSIAGTDIGPEKLEREQWQPIRVSRAATDPVPLSRSASARSRISALTTRQSNSRTMSQPIVVLDRAASLFQSTRTMDLELSADNGQPRDFLSYAFFQRTLQRNAHFARCLELAVRGATFAVLLSIPLMLPQDALPSGLRGSADTGLYTANVVVYIFFSLDHTVGETFCNVLCGISGVAVAALDILLLFTFFPEGANDSTHPHVVFWFAVIHGVLFITAVVGLNLNPLAVIYICSEYVFWWMDFLHPRGSNSPSTIWHAMQEMTGCVFGSFFCLLATVLPYPLLAISKARDTSEELVELLRVTWTDFIDYYCADQGNAYRQDKLARDLRDLQERVDKLESYIASAWWECFGLGRWGRVRAMLDGLDVALREGFDRLFSARRNCIREDFGQSHTDLMKALRYYIQEVTHVASSLLMRCTVAAADGVIDDTAAEDIKELSFTAERAITTLSNEFRSRRIKDKSVCKQLVDSHVFCLEVCAFGRLAIEYSERLLVSRSGDESSLDSKGGSTSRPNWSSIFNPAVILQKQHLLIGTKRWLAILLAFFIGYHGLGHMIQPYNAGIASITAVMINKSGGGMLAKELGRIQGVVIGAAAGQFVYDNFGQCELWAYAVRAVFFFVWAAGSMYTYFHASTFTNQYFGLLLAVAGAQSVVVRCGGDNINEHNANPPHMTFTVIQVILGTLFLFVVESIFKFISVSKRASTMAFLSYIQMWRSLGHALHSTLSPYERTYVHRTRLKKSIGRAESLSAEAYDEPRYWRLPWNSVLFGQAIDCAHHMVSSLSVLEYSLVGSVQEATKKPDCFESMIRRRTFARTRDLFMRKFKRVEMTLHLVYKVSEHSPADAKDLMDVLCRDDEESWVWNDTLAEWRDVLDAFTNDVSENAFTVEDDNTGSLETDKFAQACLLIVSLDSMMEEIASLQHGVIMA